MKSSQPAVSSPLSSASVLTFTINFLLFCLPSQDSIELWTPRLADFSHQPRTLHHWTNSRRPFSNCRVVLVISSRHGPPREHISQHYYCCWECDCCCHFLASAFVSLFASQSLPSNGCICLNLVCCLYLISCNHLLMPVRTGSNNFASPWACLRNTKKSALFVHVLLLSTLFRNNYDLNCTDLFGKTPPCF
jgi:hypothetical protein